MPKKVPPSPFLVVIPWQDLNKDLQDFVQEERQVTNGLAEDVRFLGGAVPGGKRSRDSGCVWGPVSPGGVLVPGIQLA